MGMERSGRDMILGRVIPNEHNRGITVKRSERNEFDVIKQAHGPRPDRPIIPSIYDGLF